MRCGGFTLIELLVVIGIIVVLTAMVMPVLGVVQRSVQRSNTLVVIKKADTALRQFRIDWKVYPGQASYPASGNAIGNRLYYHLGSDISTSDRQKVLSDVATFARKYEYQGADNVQWTQLSTLTFTAALFPINSEPNLYNASYQTSYACLANRMANEQVRLAALSGNLWLRGPVVTNVNYTTIVANKSGSQVFAIEGASFPSAPQSAAKPGWACDYLQGEIEKRFVLDDNGAGNAALLDAWGQPLVYISQNIPGVAGTSSIIYQSVWSTIVNNKRYGLGPIGFDTGTGPGPTLAPSRPWLLYNGRVCLSASDAGDGAPTPVDGTLCPDLSNLLRSDVRYYAPVRFIREFELWSRGPDQIFDYMRDAASNHDNISAVPYNKGL